MKTASQGKAERKSNLRAKSEKTANRVFRFALFVIIFNPRHLRFAYCSINLNHLFFRVFYDLKIDDTWLNSLPCTVHLRNLFSVL